SDPDGHQIFGVLRSRRTDRFLVDHVNSELELHRGFERVARQFAVALSGVAVSHKQQRAVVKDWEVDGRPFTNLVVVHIAAEDARIRRPDNVTTRRSDSHATETWL